MKAKTIRQTILAMADERGSDKTVCPSEIARSLAGSDENEWRKLMHPIRVEVVRLADEGRIVVKRKGRVVDHHDFKGIYRLARVEDPGT